MKPGQKVVPLWSQRKSCDKTDSSKHETVGVSLTGQSKIPKWTYLSEVVIIISFISQDYHVTPLTNTVKPTFLL